ncbi:MAG TPA: hypothetical protein VIX19_11605 [Terriglobales bacterium]
MIHQLIPWNILTRTGVIPPLKVARRDLVLGEVIIPVGTTVDPEVFPLQIRRQRLRQFYEMRLLELVDPPRDSRQFYRERQAPEPVEPPIAPVTPVASRIVADLPGVDVAELDDVPRKPPKGAR